MQEKIDLLVDEINSFTANGFKDAEEFRLKYLSKNGKVSVLFDEFKEVAAEQKRALGKPLNELKNLAQNKLNEIQEKFTQTSVKENNSIEKYLISLNSTPYKFSLCPFFIFLLQVFN